MLLEQTVNGADPCDLQDGRHLMVRQSLSAKPVGKRRTQVNCFDNGEASVLTGCLEDAPGGTIAE
jgi:hypothetical protein